MTSAQILLALVAITLAVARADAQAPAGPILWLRADSGVAATGGRVDLWRDVSGHGNDARQDVASQQPTLIPKAANGLPTVRFDGSNYMLAASVFPVHADYSLTFVVKINDFAAANNVVSGVSHAHWLGGNAYPKVIHNGNFASQTVSPIAVTSGHNVVTMTYAESRHRLAIYVDGLFADSAVNDPNVDPAIYLGAYAAANYMNGDLSEVLLYDRDLGTAELAGLHSYLIDKYAVTIPRPYAPPAAGPVLWLKADSGVVAAVDGRVARWLDRSGNGYAARQDTAALRPTLLRNATFNMPAVRFSGAGDFMEASPVFPANSDYSLLFVVRLNNLGAPNNVVSGVGHAHWFGGDAQARVLHNGNFNAQAKASISIVQSEFTVVTMTYLEARARAAIYINSHFADSATVGPNPDSTIFVGAFAGANVLNGDLAEVLIYRRELSAADRAATETYLFRKYGIAVPPPPPPPDSTFSEIPKSQQLYARDTNDSAAVRVAGVVRLGGYDSIHVTILRDGLPFKRVAARLAYNGGAAPFALAPTIRAAMSEYRFTIGLSAAGRDTVLAVRDSIVCGDVILIDGQSNSIFGGVPDSYEFFRTFGRNFSSNRGDTLWTLARADGSGGGPHVGAWGLRMGKMLMDRAGVPICIINGGVGGTTVEQHQRNDANPTDVATIYGSMLYRVRKSGLDRAAKALLWYQGESNTIDNYYANFKALYDDWRADYPSVRKFYVVQIRPGCAAGPHGALRELLRTLPDSLPDIKTFSPMGVDGHDGCHFAVAGYDTIGAQLYRLVARDFYGLDDTVDINSPDIIKAFYADSSRTTIALVFTSGARGLYFTPDTTVGGVSAGIKDAFYLDDSIARVRSARTAGDTVYLALSAPYTAATISYIPSQSYPGTSAIYEGPWLKNMRGVGAFSFHHFPITAADPGASVPVVTARTLGLAAIPNPFSARTELRVTAAVAGPLTIVLYDAAGREAMRRSVAARAGENSIPIERGDLPAGIYLCTVTSGGGEKSISIIAR